MNKIEFENTKYNCPNDLNYYLTKVYGDYLDIPKYIFHHHNRFNILREMDDGVEFYKQCINRLHEVNQSY